MSQNTRHRGTIELRLPEIQSFNTALKQYGNACECITTLTKIERMKAELRCQHFTTTTHTVEVEYTSNEERNLLLRVTNHALNNTSDNQLQTLSKTIEHRLTTNIDSQIESKMESQIDTTKPVQPVNAD